MAAKPNPPADHELCAHGDLALARGFELLGQRWNGVVLGSLSVGAVITARGEALTPACRQISPWSMEHLPAAAG